jgi:glycerol kinase
VLEGVAQRGADLVEAAEADSGTHLASVRVDGGMSANQIFVQTLANAVQKPVEVSPQLEATTVGAGFLAGLAIGTWGSDDDVAATWRPARIVDPVAALDRDRWREACRRAQAWIPELSSLDF